MKTRLFPIICVLLAMLFNSSCSPAAPEPTPTPEIIATPTPTQADLPANGTISGSIQADNTFSGEVQLFALETDTGEWASKEILLLDGKSDYQFDLPVGRYKLFFHSEGGMSGGYTETGQSLKSVAVGGGEAVSGITIIEVLESDCGPMFSIPTSPDGVYAAIEGAAPDCLAELADEMS